MPDWDITLDGLVLPEEIQVYRRGDYRLIRTSAIWVAFRAGAGNHLQAKKLGCAAVSGNHIVQG